MSARFDTLLGLRERLGARGVKPLGDWWLDALREWYASPIARTLAVCAGRGSAKSHALYFATLNETLFGDFDIPIGERHSANLTSRLKDEAAKGSAILSQWLTLLDIPHTPTDGLIELAGMPRDIRITAASVAANSGWRSFFDGDDETGKWPAEGALAVDAYEVLASKSGQCTTHPSARRMIVSSPMLDSGPFFEIVTAGTNGDQVVRVAPTWIATDGRITEEQTRRLEKNPRRHAREFGAQFGVEWEQGYFVGLIEPCIVEDAPEGWEPIDGTAYVMAIDPAFSRDQFAVCVAHHERDGVVRVDLIDVIERPIRAERLEPTYALESVQSIAEQYDVEVVQSDQASFAALSALAERIGLYLSEEPWTASSKGPAFDYVRTLMRDRKLLLPNDAGLRREFSGIGVRLLPSGHEQVTARPGFADDRVSAAVMAICHASQLPPRIAAERKPGQLPRAYVVPTPLAGRWRSSDERDPFAGVPGHVSEVTTTDATGERVTHHRDDHREGGIWGNEWG